MEQATEIKNRILEAKNICVIPTDEPESLANALALFYTLKELGKNVNLIVDELPKRISFLTPSLDFISSPKNFVISIPRSSADISQIYYEKTDDNLKIHLTIDQGQIKKEHLSFYFEDAKPDLIVTIGVADFQKQLSEKLNSFGFLLGSDILNIDNSLENKKFGGINLVEQKSLSEIVFDFTKSISEKSIDANTANCLLTGLTIHYENFKSSRTTPGVFELAAELMKKGANNKQIADNLYATTELQMRSLAKILHSITTDRDVSLSLIENDKELADLSPQEISHLVEKIKIVGPQNNLLVLWNTPQLQPTISGFFYSTATDALQKVAGHYSAKAYHDWVLLSINETNMNIVRETIINLLHEKRTNISLYADALK